MPPFAQKIASFVKLTPPFAKFEPLFVFLMILPVKLMPPSVILTLPFVKLQAPFVILDGSFVKLTPPFVILRVPFVVLRDAVGEMAGSIRCTTPLRRRATQPVRDARPFRQIRRCFHDNQIRARLVAAVQLCINRPGECFCIVGYHAHAGKIFCGRNLRVRDDEAS
jgi:hypothetical protein